LKKQEREKKRLGLKRRGSLKKRLPGKRLKRKG